jgi:HD-GYP domain-containing protein (c-di-GMP phosphodiesterase class II)
MVSKESRSTLAQRLSALQEISVELMAAGSPESLRRLMVEKAMKLIVCDAASLFLKAESAEVLEFEVAINKTIRGNLELDDINTDSRSMVALVYRTGVALRVKDVYADAETKGFAYHASHDQRNAYRTRSACCIPLKNQKGKVLGVLQLLNKKKSMHEDWPSNDEVELAKMPFFTMDDQKLLESFAAVATASVESVRMQGRIEHLFDSFVRASVYAIDSRDPGTRGHSERVATMTVELAKIASSSEVPLYTDVKLSFIQIRELLYAGLLHDFGKIGVREATLQKASKLNEAQLFRLEKKVTTFLRAFERNQFLNLLEKSRKDNRAVTEIEIFQIERDVREFRGKLDQCVETVRNLARPSILDEEASVKLYELEAMRFEVDAGVKAPLLEPEDVEALSIKRGCLTEAERLEVESHVTQSYLFLRQIPWGEDFAKIPEIAYGHHELLNGTGYPRRLKGDEIHVCSRMMTVCDIFDALCAADRAYKKALPVSRTLAIMDDMVLKGQLEGRFVDLFKEHTIWRMHHYENDDTLDQLPRKIAG